MPSLHPYPLLRLIEPVALAAILVLASCNEHPTGSVFPDDDSVGDDDDATPCTDVDADTWCAFEDCDDFNTLANPGLAEVCDDLRDNDCDNATDCDDADCAATPECNIPTTETSCTNGLDDDQDGQVDCLDTDCVSEPICTPPCADGSLGSAVGTPVATGSTAGYPAVETGSCSSNGSEFIYQWVAPSTGAFVIDTYGSGYDTALYVRQGSCQGPELACNDDTVGLQSEVTISAVAGQTYYIFVDGYSGSGSYVLNIGSGGGGGTPGPNCYSDNHTIAASGGFFSDVLDTLDGSNGPRGAGYYFDDIEFSASAGQFVDIEVTSASFSDSYLYLLDPTCTQIASDDDGGVSLLSRISMTLPASGVYTIIVTTFSTSTTGSYTVQTW